MMDTYIQMAAALFFVIILIVAVGYFLRKKQNHSGLMNIISYQPIGAKKGVAALKIGKEILILGVTTNDMRLLKVFNENELDLKEQDGFSSKLEKFKSLGA